MVCLQVSHEVEFHSLAEGGYAEIHCGWLALVEGGRARGREGRSHDGRRREEDRGEGEVGRGEGGGERANKS